MTTWAITPREWGTLPSQFLPESAEWVTDFDRARDIAFDMSIDAGGAPMVLWRVPPMGKACAWMEVTA